VRGNGGGGRIRTGA